MVKSLVDIVDRAFIVTCTKHRSTRLRRVVKELYSLGLEGKVELITQTSSPIELLVTKHASIQNSGAKDPGVVNCWIGHYRAIKTGYELGYSRIMVVEDDARFLKDHSKMSEYISELPENTYCAILELGVNFDTYKEAFGSYSSLWGTYTSDKRCPNGTCAYILNRDAMRDWISLCEKTLTGETTLDASDRMYPHLAVRGKVLFPKEPLVIQDTRLGGVSASTWRNFYANLRIDISKYGVEDILGATVVYASDGRDYDRLEMSIGSVRKYIGDDTRIILLTPSDPPAIHGIEVINPVPYMDDLGLHGRGWNRHWPFATLYRLSIPIIEDLNKTERILYLDTDTLVRSRDARNLFTMSLDDYEIWSAFDIEDKHTRVKLVIDNDIPEHVKHVLRERIWDRRGTRIRNYANAGVILMNLDQIRKNGIDWYRRRINLFWDIECNGKFGFLDQDFINTMMDNNPCLNKTVNWFGGDYRTDCVIQHFCGGSKSGMLKVAKEIGVAR